MSRPSITRPLESRGLARHHRLPALVRRAVAVRTAGIAAKWDTAALTAGAADLVAPAPTRPSISICAAAIRHTRVPKAQAGPGPPRPHPRRPASRSLPEQLRRDRAVVATPVSTCSRVETARLRARAVDDLPEAAPPSIATRRKGGEAPITMCVRRILRGALSSNSKKWGNVLAQQPGFAERQPRPAVAVQVVAPEDAETHGEPVVADTSRSSMPAAHERARSDGERILLLEHLLAQLGAARCRHARHPVGLLLARVRDTRDAGRMPRQQGARSPPASGTYPKSRENFPPAGIPGRDRSRRPGPVTSAKAESPCSPAPGGRRPGQEQGCRQPRRGNAWK
jgi:hypothetical protein